jgi:signal transduction histidine kinase
LSPVLRDSLPFFFYLPAILVAAALFGLRAGLATLVGSLFLTVGLWMPGFSWHDVDPNEALVLAAWFSISALLVIAIALLQRSTTAQRKLIATLHSASQQLEEKSSRLEASEKNLAAHAADLERIVAERTARLEETITELESYSYTIVHDLRSPLRAMQGFSHVLVVDYADKLDVRGADYLRRIERAAQRLDVLIQGVLSYSDIGQAKMELQPVDLEVVVDQVINHYPTIHDARAGIEIVPPLGRVIAHEAFLAQALSNLLENAIKFVQAGTPPQITIRAETRGPNIRLHVVDRGIGIPATGLANIFKPFHRGHEAAGYVGTGMGLAVVKRAIERQGGTVGVFSEPNNGSDFWLELPRALEEPPHLSS